MFLNTFRSIAPSYQLIFKDKIALLLAALPVFLGVILYFLVGKYFFGGLFDWGNQYLQKYLENSTLGDIAYYLIASILSILFYFLVSWTFVMILSIIASPFNDLLSERIEKLLKSQGPRELNETLRLLLKNMFITVFNECKKLIVILFLSFLAMILGYFPLFLPLSFAISAILLAIGFVDYSWGRHRLSFKHCQKDVKSHWVSYLLGGAFFMILISIPFLNIFIPSLATSYFTVLWVKNNEPTH